MSNPPSLRIALCQTHPTLGALDTNVDAMVAMATLAAAAGAQLAIYPELAICGYPPRDLLERPAFLRDVRTALERFSLSLPPGLQALVGFAESDNARVHNSLALCEQGGFTTAARKCLLPSYDVFDDARWFTPGDAPAVLPIAGAAIGLTICEDAWNDTRLISERAYAINPIADIVDRGASILVNAAASPFTLEKRALRARMFAEIAKKYGRFLIFVNQVGGFDDLVFDGQSAVFGPDGDLRARAAAFREDLLLCDITASPQTTPNIATTPDTDAAAALEALTLGTRDHLHHCGFRTAVLGLSGGIDSAVVAAIAARALGPDNVLGIALPTRYSSADSLEDARALAANLGIRFQEIPIDPLFQAYLDALPPHLDALAPPTDADVTFENIQSRIRCAVLMAVSNRTGRVLLTTGNKSEIAVGYCTLYGDMAGGLGVIADLLKTFVYDVAAEINRQSQRALIPERTLTKAPSAELRPNQTDQDSLPPYAQLDAVIRGHVEEGEGEEQLVARGLPADVVRRVLHLIRASEHKRRQMPPGLVITKNAFGPGRRVPIANHWQR